jgi:putative transposase
MGVLSTNNSSVFNLSYLLILLIDEDKDSISLNISNALKEIFNNIAPNYNITLQAWNLEEDVFKINFTAHPNSSISKFINSYKSTSSRLIKKQYFQTSNFWTNSFLLLTLGELPIDNIEEFIISQRNKREKRKKK